MNKKEIAAAYADADMSTDGFLLATLQTVDDVVAFFDFARLRDRDLAGAVITIEEAGEDDARLVVLFPSQHDVPQALLDQDWPKVEKAVRGAYYVKIFGSDVTVDDVLDLL